MSVTKKPISTKRTKTSKLVTKMFDNANIPTSEQNWDDVINIHADISNGIIDIAIKFNDSLRIIRDSGKYNNDAELIATVNSFKNDINEFTNALCSIDSRREGKVGKIDNQDDLVLCLDIFNDLVILFDRFKAIVFAPMLTITEYLSNIHNDELNKEKLITETIETNEVKESA